MHEISLVENIIEIITTEMPKHGISTVETITLKIGDMQHVVPDALTFGFEIVSKDTPLEGAELIIENVPAKARCKTCGSEFVVEDWWDNCPKCDSVEIEIISGKELEIVEFEGA
jgi:hydrogenase nickel incorporation protein HypA/HybF